MRVSGVSKDAEWIADTLRAECSEICGGNMELIQGLHMDNTKANRKACASLKDEFPSWVNLGCCGHGLALLIGDLAKAASGKNKLHSPAISKVLDNCKFVSMVLGDNEKMRAVVAKHQVSKGSNILSNGAADAGA